MDTSSEHQGFMDTSRQILDRLDQRVSRPVVPMSSISMHDLCKKADAVAISINALFLLAIVGTAAVQGQWPSLPERSALLAAAFLSSAHMRPVRHKLVRWWVNRTGKDAPATIDQMLAMSALCVGQTTTQRELGSKPSASGDLTLATQSLK